MSQELAVQNDQLGLSHLSASICAELAAGLADAEGIRAKYELTDEQWKKLSINPAFRNMLKDALERFTGDMNAGRRILLKAEILLEDSLPVLDAIIHDKEGASSNKLDSIKQLTQLAQKGGRGEGSGAGGGTGFDVQIHINTGGGNEAVPHVVIDQPADD